MDEKVRDLYFLSHNSTLRIRVSILIFIYQVLKESGSIESRFYRACYDLILSNDIRSSSSTESFFDLLFNIIKDDHSIPRVKAFIKRLLQVNPNYVYHLLIFEKYFRIVSTLNLHLLFQAFYSSPEFFRLIQVQKHF
jgi:ribosome biogenesis protein MAK21